MISFLGPAQWRRCGSAASAMRRPRSAPTRSSSTSATPRVAAALRQLPVRAVPRHERPECLPGEMRRRGRPPVADGVGGRPRLSSPASAHAGDRCRATAARSPQSCGRRRAEAGRRPSRRRPRRRTTRTAEEPAARRRPPRRGADRRPPPPGRAAAQLPDPVDQDNPGAVRAPPPEAFPTDQIPVPDRWRLIDSARAGAATRWFDPYNQNTSRATGRSPAHRRGAGAPPGRRHRALRMPRFLGRRRRLVLRRQRRLRHGDRAAHLPDPGRRADHRAARQPRRVRPARQPTSCRRPSSSARR